MVEGSAKGRRRRKHMILGVAVAIVVAVIIILSLYRFGAFPFDEDREYRHSYILEIEADDGDEYTLICPVPLNMTGVHYLGFLDDLVATVGDVDASIVDTIHGKGLRVSGSGNAKLEWKASWDDDDGDWYLNLSMTSGLPLDWHDQSRDSWMYSDTEEVDVRWGYNSVQTHRETPCFISGGGPIYTLPGYGFMEPVTGWQEVVVEFNWVVYN